MTMRQNSSNYSENDSAGLELDPSIKNLIAPNAKGSVEVKFDGYGTLHVLERDNEGGLKSDSYLARKDDDDENITNDFTNIEKLERLQRKNAKLNIAVKIEKILIIAFAIFFILFCLLLKLTLQRYM